VLEVTQVGRALQSSHGPVQLYTHTPDRGGAGGGSPADEILDALQAAAAASSGAAPGGVTVSPAGAATPGLPPIASAGSFVRLTNSGGDSAAAPSLPAVLLAGFDEAFQGSTFQTQYDSLDTVDADSIAATAVVLARAAHALALDGSVSPAPLLPVDLAAVKARVAELMQVSLMVGAAQPMPSPLVQLLLS
jgi:hypothetical protein